MVCRRITLLALSLLLLGCLGCGSPKPELLFWTTRTIGSMGPTNAVAIVPADGSAPSVASGFEHLVSQRARVYASRGTLAEQYLARDWQPGDRVAFGGMTCGGSLGNGTVSCLKMGEGQYMSRRQIKFKTCQPSDNLDDVCWTTYKVYLQERWYTDRSCSVEDTELAMDYHAHVCD
jgi:hypothetical protein